MPTQKHVQTPIHWIIFFHGTNLGIEVFKPIGNLLRVSLPCDIRASPRLDPKEQQNDIEKGGHGIPFVEELLAQHFMNVVKK